MKIRGISLKNFMSFGEISHVKFGDKFNVIVGPNDSGKTSIFRAIGFLSDVFGNKTRGRDFESFVEPYYHNGSNTSPIEISVAVEFDNDEKRALTNFLICSSLLIASQHDEVVRKAEKELIIRHGEQAFGELFNDTTIIIRVQRRQMYPVTAYLCIKGQKGKELYIHNLGVISTSPHKPASYSQRSLVDIMLIRAGLDISTIKHNPTGVFEAVEKHEPASIFDTMLYILSGLDDGKSIRVVDIQGINFSDIENKLEHFFKIDSLDEGHSLVRFMRERGFADEGVNLFEIIRTIYDYSLIRTSNSRCVPGQTILGRKMEKSTDTHEFTTDHLPKELFRLKNSINPEERDAYKRIHEEFLRTTNAGFEVVLQEKMTETEVQEFTLFNPSLHLNPLSTVTDNISGIGIRPKRTQNLHHEMVICFIKNGLVVPIHMAAAGMLETLYLLTVVIAPRKKTILLDEPALNLHPIMQRKILDTLLTYSIKKNCNQVVLVTHSPSMLEVSGLDTIHRLSMGKDATQITNMQAAINKLESSDKKQLMQWLRNVEIRSLLFSRGIILVEGPSDKVVVEAADKHISEKGKGANIQDREIVVISVGGKKSMRIFLALAKEIGMNCLVVVDSDALMNCEGNILVNSKKVRTSAIIQALHEAQILSAEDAALVEELEKEVISSNVDLGAYEYRADEHVISTLRSIAERYDVLVLPKNLEAALQIKKGRSRKPVMSADIIFERIENNSVPLEIEKLIDNIRVRTGNW